MNRDWFGNLMLWLFECMTKRPIVYYGTVFILVILVGIGAWNLKRWVNWQLAYGDDVRMAVCEMVKPEALKDPSVCGE